MGIFTKTKFFLDGISYMTELRLIKRRFGPFSLFIDTADVKKGNEHEAFKICPDLYKQAKFVHLFGTVPLFGEGVYTAQFFNDRGVIFATVLFRKRRRDTRFFSFDNEGKMKTMSHLLSEVAMVGGKLRYRSYLPVSTLGAPTDSRIEVAEIVYDNKDPDDYDLASEERSYLRFVNDGSSSYVANPTTIDFKLHNGRVHKCYMDVNGDRTVGIEADLPSGKRLYILQNPVPVDRDNFNEFLKGVHESLAYAYIDLSDVHTLKYNNGKGDGETLTDEQLVKIYSRLYSGERVQGLDFRTENNI